MKRSRGVAGFSTLEPKIGGGGGLWQDASVAGKGGCVLDGLSGLWRAIKVLQASDKKRAALLPEAVDEGRFVLATALHLGNAYICRLNLSSIC